MIRNLFIFLVVFNSSGENGISCEEIERFEDKTIQAYADGEDVMEATMQKINVLLNTGDEDIRLWRRVALAASDWDGNGKAARSNPDGGIWQISSSIDSTVAATLWSPLSGDPVKTELLKNMTRKIFEDGCFLCSTNYSSPMRSAFAAKLYIIVTDAPVNGDVYSQSQWWSMTYQPGGNRSIFEEKALKHDIRTGCTDLQADIWFMVDGSKLVSADQFKKQLDFVKETISHFRISRRHVQLGFSTFFFHHDIVFNFTLNQPNYALFIDSFSSTTLPDESNRTGRALNDIVEEVFTSDRGVRSSSDRFLFFITNSKTFGEVSSASKRLHDNNISLLVLNAAGNNNTETLKEIASSPSSSNLLNFNPFSDMNSNLTVENLANKVCNIITSRTVAYTLLSEFEKENLNESNLVNYINSMLHSYGFPCFPCNGSSSSDIQQTLDLMRNNRSAVYDPEARGKLLESIVLWAEEYLNGDCDSERKVDIWLLLDGVNHYKEDDVLDSFGFMKSFIEHLSKRVWLKSGFSFSYWEDHEIASNFSESVTFYAAFERIKSTVKPSNRLKKAFEELLDVGFDEVGGARIQQTLVEKYLVFISSNDELESDLRKVANMTREKEVNVISVVIGSNATKHENVTSQPSSLYSFRAANYDELNEISLRIPAFMNTLKNEKLCSSPVNLTESRATPLALYKGRSQYLFRDAWLNDTITVRVIEWWSSSFKGKIYVSSFIPKPNAALFDAQADLKMGVSELSVNVSYLVSRHLRLRLSVTENTTNKIRVYITLSNTGAVDVLIKASARGKLNNFENKDPGCADDGANQDDCYYPAHEAPRSSDKPPQWFLAVPIVLVILSVMTWTYFLSHQSLRNRKKLTAKRTMLRIVNNQSKSVFNVHVIPETMQETSSEETSSESDSIPSPRDILMKVSWTENRFVQKGDDFEVRRLQELQKDLNADQDPRRHTVQVYHQAKFHDRIIELAEHQLEKTEEIDEKKDDVISTEEAAEAAKKKEKEMEGNEDVIVDNNNNNVIVETKVEIEKKSLIEKQKEEEGVTSEETLKSEEKGGAEEVEKGGAEEKIAAEEEDTEVEENEKRSPINSKISEEVEQMRCEIEKATDQTEAVQCSVSGATERVVRTDDINVGLEDKEEDGSFSLKFENEADLSAKEIMEDLPTMSGIDHSKEVTISPEDDTLKQGSGLDDADGSSRRSVVEMSETGEVSNNENSNHRLIEEREEIGSDEKETSILTLEKVEVKTTDDDENKHIADKADTES